MKKIINGKLYDTNTARLLATYDSEYSKSDYEYYFEELYRKKTGEYFVYGKGGPNSHYAEYLKDVRQAGEGIRPMTEKDAKEWAELRLTADEYIKIFGDVEE